MKVVRKVGFTRWTCHFGQDPEGALYIITLANHNHLMPQVRSSSIFFQRKLRPRQLSHRDMSVRVRPRL